MRDWLKTSLTQVTQPLAIEYSPHALHEIVKDISTNNHICTYTQAEHTQSCAVSDTGSPSSGLPRDGFGGFEDCQRNKEKKIATP